MVHLHSFTFIVNAVLAAFIIVVCVSMENVKGTEQQEFKRLEEGIEGKWKYSSGSIPTMETTVSLDMKEISENEFIGELTVVNYIKIKISRENSEQQWNAELLETTEIVGSPVQMEIEQQFLQLFKRTLNIAILESFPIQLLVENLAEEKISVWKIFDS